MKTPKPDSSTTDLEFWTPKMAADGLKHNTNNRTCPPLRVDRLSQAIRRGEWQATHQGIAFNCDGTLIDGQTRLAAIVKSETGVWIRVTRGLPRDVMRAIDQGRNRSPGDVCEILELGFTLNRNKTAIARAMERGVDIPQRVHPMTNTEVLNFAGAHIEAIEWASKLTLGRTGCSTARGIFARAYYSADRSRLEEFANVLHDGKIATAADSAAISLRDLIITIGTTIGSNSHRVSIARKTERALEFFLKKKPRKLLDPVTEELFPLPSGGK